ncbi:hypothetical protein ACFE04_028132 [Oxalis oulophora]
MQRKVASISYSSPQVQGFSFGVLASLEDEDQAQKKEKTGDLASVAEVVSIVSMKVPRRKMKRHATSRQFKLVRSSLGDSNSSSEDGENTAASSPTGMEVEKKMVASSFPDELLVGQPKAFVLGVAEATPEANLESDGVDAKGQVCPSHVPEESEATPIGEEAQASHLLKVRGNLKEGQALMPEAPGKGGED